MENEIIKTHPAVFAVEDEYQIMVCVTCPVLMWVQVGDEKFFDDSNGILRSNVTTHRMRVPAELLNSAGAYTLCYRKIVNRKPYFTETEDEVQLEYSFRPVPADRAVAYHISDAHNQVVGPLKAAHSFVDKYGPIDFLILNGDIPNDSGKIEYFDHIYEIVSDLTEGQIPVLFARGNHDTRGFFAENIAEYTPNGNGNTYYTFRLGSIWGLIMDCGEDKVDSCDAYGHTVCFRQFRLRQSRWLEKVAATKEYEDPSIQHKIVLVHAPFPVQYEAERFNIEKDIYDRWCHVLKTEIRPELMISGHFHTQFNAYPGDDIDGYRRIPCPIAIGSTVEKKSDLPQDQRYYAAGGFIFEEGKITRITNDNCGEFLEETVFETN